MALVGDAMGIFMAIRHDDVCLVRFDLINQADPQLVTHHQEGLAQRSTALSEYFVGVEGDDIAQREDKRMNIFHV